LQDYHSRETEKYCQESRGTWTHEWLCWWGPAAIHPAWSNVGGYGAVQRTVAGFCEHGNETLGFVQYWELLEWLSNFCFPKIDSALWS
jgi:hypothetical protein